MFSSYKEKQLNSLKEENLTPSEATIIEIYEVGYYKITIMKNRRFGSELVYIQS